MMRGDKVKVELGQIDAMALDVSGTVIERLSSVQANPETALDAEQEMAELEELETAASGPIAIAMNVNESVADDPAPI